MRIARSLWIVTICWTILLTSCRPTETDHQTADVAVRYLDTAFWQEYHEPWPLNLASGEDVTSVAIDAAGNSWLTTTVGVFVKRANLSDWEPALPEKDQGPAFDVAVAGESVWVAMWNDVYRFQGGGYERMSIPLSPVAKLCPASEGMYAVGPHGVWLHNEDGWTNRHYSVARSIRDAVTDGHGGLWIASDVGLYHATGDTTVQFIQPADLISAYVRGVVVTGDSVWAAGLGGVSILQPGKDSRFLSPGEGIPSVNVNCIRRAPDGTMWVGTDVGVVRIYQDGSTSLRFSRRWLLDDRVLDIAFDGEGDAWVATPSGASVIRRRPLTLARKEEFFYHVLMRRHIRSPWIAGQCRLPVAGDTSRWEPEDDDNDGEYTGNYLAMESFRYAATKSEDARLKARRAFNFLKMLCDVTGSDGFFARTIVPASWTTVHDGNRTYDERQRAVELIKEPRFKPVEKRWHKSADGQWLWKGDTSSDEICGHMFGYFMYYELVADEEERKIVGQHIARIVDHLINHDFTLTDVDDKPTRWGVWSPNRLNRDPEWQPDRSLNSMEILSFLKLAYHTTGDEKYEKTYRHLIHEEGYLRNMANIPHQNRAWFIYFDAILAAYQYPVLLRCERDPELLTFYRQHIDQWLEARRGDQNPLINFIYSFSTGTPAGLTSSIAFLQDTPLDLVDWDIDHTKREDIHLVHQPVLDDLQVDRLPPASIRATVRWDKNPWGVNKGNPHMEREPVFWLLPYWMGRYQKMIDQE